MSETLDRAQTIFLNALDLNGDRERAAFIARECGQDADLRREVEDLLAHAGRLGRFLDADDAERDTSVQPVRETSGDVIGPYKLLQKIGEGGMGIVYMAEQTKPVARRVALKIIKPGMDSQHVIARFEAERQALAMMDHPNIARVLDAGTTDSGRPYFVMELVKGVPVTQYCDEEHLTPRERLELFLPICHAVQHAHQKGIIHRDLKPSNILVAQYDDRAVPKVIDFGVAKAISQKLTEKTMFTQYGQIVGTIEYMSPEQARFNQLDVDTRSDIYSLGVLLYELLTGETPFDRTRLRSAAFDELLRIIREEEPPRPSTRLSSSQTLPSIAANRKTEPRKLSTLMQGELDWIVMKAMEKDRVRRYETANQFAVDLQHYLNDEAVTACPPSASYRFRKFAKRNRGVLMTSAVVAAALLVGTIVSSWQAIIASRARDAESAARKDAEQARNQAVTAQAQEAEQRKQAEQQREQATANLYDSLVREVQSLRLARKSGYQELAWKRLNEARQLETPKVDLEQLRDEAVLCSGDYVGIAPRDIEVGEEFGTIALNPDATLLAVGTDNGDVRLFDLQENAWVGKLEKHEYAVCSLEFGKNGKRLVTGDRMGHVTCWEQVDRSWIEVHSTEFESGEVRDQPSKSEPLICRLTPDSEQFVLSYFGTETLQFRDFRSGHVLREFDTGDARVLQAALSPIGNTLAVMVHLGDEDSSLAIWNSATQELKRIVPLQRGDGNFVAYSPGGEHLACSADQGLTVFDADTGEAIFGLSGNIIPDLAFSPDGKLLAHRSRFSNSISVWNLVTKRLEAALDCPSPANAICFARKASVLAAANGTSVRMWSLGKTPEKLALSGHARGVPGVAFSPDNKTLVTVSKDRTVKIWDTASGRLVKSLEDFEASVQGVAFSPRGDWLATCDWSGHVDLWNTQSWTRSLRIDVNSLGLHPVLWSVAFSADERFFGVAGEGVLVWSMGELRRCAAARAEVSLKPALAISGIGQVRVLSFSPDSKTMATISSIDSYYQVLQWDLEQGVETWAPPVSAAMRVLNLQFFGNGRYLMYWAAGGTTQTWDLVEKRLVNSVAGGGHGSISPDGRLFTNDMTVRLTDSGSELVTLPRGAGSGGVWCAAWSSDRKLLAMGFSDGDVALWNLEQLRSRLQEINLGWRQLPSVSEQYEFTPQQYPTADVQRLVAEWSRYRGTLSLVKKNTSVAQAYFQSCLDMQADADHRPLNRLLLSLAQQDWERAAQSYREIPGPIPVGGKSADRIAAYATNAGWQLARSADITERRSEAAVALTELAAALQPDNWNIHANWGVALYRAGRFEEALQRFQRADELRTGGDRVHRMFLAMTLWQLGRKDEALQFYLDGVCWIDRYKSEDGAFLGFRGEAERLLGITPDDRTAMMREFYLTSFPDQPSESLVIDRLKWFQKESARLAPEERGELLQHVATTVVANAATHAVAFELRSCGDRLGKDGHRDDALLAFETALAVWERCAELEPDNHGIACEQAVILTWMANVDSDESRRTGYLDKAEELLRPVVEFCEHNGGHDEEYAVALKMQGEVALKRQKWKTASEYFEKSISLNAQDPWAHFGLLVAYNNMPEVLPETIVERTQVALRSHPKFQWIQDRSLQLVNALSARNCREQAKQILDTILEVNPSNIAALGTRGKWAKQAGDNAVAIAAFSKAIEIDSGIHWLYQARAACLRDLGKLTEALGDANKAVELKPNDAVNRFRRAQILLELEESEAALDDAVAGLKSNPSHDWGWWLLAESDRKVREPDRLRDAFQTLNETLGPLAEALVDRPDIWMTYATLLLSDGDRPAYQQLAQHVFGRHADTEDPKTARQLIELLTIGPNAVADWDAALELLEKLPPGKVMQARTKLLTRAGRLEEASQARRELIAARDPEKPHPFDSLWLGLIEHGRGNRDLAEAHLQEALKIAEAHPNAKQTPRFILLQHELDALLSPSRKATPTP